VDKVAVPSYASRVINWMQTHGAVKSQVVIKNGTKTEC